MSDDKVQGMVESAFDQDLAEAAELYDKMPVDQRAEFVDCLMKQVMTLFSVAYTDEQAELAHRCMILGFGSTVMSWKQRQQDTIDGMDIQP